MFARSDGGAMDRRHSGGAVGFATNLERRSQSNFERMFGPQSFSVASISLLPDLYWRLRIRVRPRPAM